ncbi:MAG: hypothetical protein ACI9SC_000668 [Gammaproteobacteria bacterium]|jgi:hypothetical protein
MLLAEKWCMDAPLTELRMQIESNNLSNLFRSSIYTTGYSFILIPLYSMDSRQKHAGMTSFVFPGSKEYYIFTHRFCGRALFWKAGIFYLLYT